MNKTYELDDKQRIYKKLIDYKMKSQRGMIESVKENIVENDAERRLSWK